MNGMIEVIDELGTLLAKYKDEIKFKDYEIDSLKRKIEEIESYNAFYNHEISEDEYTEILNKQKCFK